MNVMCNGHTAFWDPGEGPKGQISLNYNYKVYFIFFYQTLCRYKRHQTVFSFRRLGHVPRVGLGGAGGQKHSYVAYQIKKR